MYKLKCKYYEGSAKTGENIEFIMNEIAKITYFENKKSEEKTQSFILSSSGNIEEESNRKKVCCKNNFFIRITFFILFIY